MSEPQAFFIATASNKRLGLSKKNLEGLFYGDGTRETRNNPQHRLISWEIRDAEEKMDAYVRSKEDAMNLFFEKNDQYDSSNPSSLKELSYISISK